MTNKNSTKRALFASAMALLLCFTMLLGTTYAWFTDSVTSSGNKIVAGTLDVDLLMADASGKYDSIAGVDAAIFGEGSLAQDNAQETLWEPGKTQIVYLGIENKGSLDLKYNIAIDVVDGGLIGSLEYAIIDGAKYGEITASDWETIKANAQTGDIVAGTTVAAPNGAIKADEDIEYFALAVHMKEEADNKYQGKDITIDVTVLATQLASESDSFGSDYDDVTLVATEAALSAALANGGKVVLAADINALNVVTLADIPAGVSAELDLNGHNITSSLDGAAGWSQMFRVGKGASLTVKGEGNVHAVAYPTTSYGSVIFNNVGGTLVIDGGTYTMDYGTYDEGYLLPSIVDTNSNIGKATTIINGGTFYHNRNMFRNFAQPNRGENNASLIINGGTFNGEPDDYASIWNQKTTASAGVVGDGIVELNGGTFNYIDISNDFQDDTCIKIASSITNVTINH